MITPNDIQDAQNDLDHKITEYLQTNGWRNTSHNPACLVLWEKEYAGRTIQVSEQHALLMQRGMET